MLKDESNPSYSSQQRSPNQSSYTNILTQASPLHTPSSDHHDADALSDAGTYIIEDDLDIARDDEPEPDIDQPTQENQIEQPTTFDIHALTSSPSTATTTQTVNRPIVDLNIPTHDITSPSSSTSSANLSSSSSLLSLPTESDNSTRKEPEGASHYLPDDSTSSAALIYARQRPTSLSQQQQPQHRPITPPQSQLKPAECFGKNRHPAVKTMNNFEFFLVISPTFETKPFPNSTRRKLDTQWKYVHFHFSRFFQFIQHQFQAENINRRSNKRHEFRVIKPNIALDFSTFDSFKSKRNRTILISSPTTTTTSTRIKILTKIFSSYIGVYSIIKQTLNSSSYDHSRSNLFIITIST